MMSMRRRGIVLATAAIALLGVMVFSALELASSQHKTRRDVERRYTERAGVSAALTQSIFSSSANSGQADAAKRYGAAKVSPQTLAAAVKRGNLEYAILLDPKGKVMASSPGTPALVLRRLATTPPYVRQVLRGQSFELTDVSGKGRQRTLGYASPVPTRFGRRVLVSGFPPQLISAFLNGYLRKIPIVKGGAALVVDSRGAIVGSGVRSKAEFARQVDPDLAGAISDRNSGTYGHDRYFASSRVGNSTWRVVISAPGSRLFASVRGTRKWVPWLLFAGFGLAAAFALVLLGRVLRSSADLAEANRRLESSNEELEMRAVELARSNSELQQFASIASHDLQEPLRKVQTFAEQLKRRDGEQLSERGRDYVERMSSAAARMQMLVDDLLKFSRVATHTKPFQPVDMGTVTHEIVDDLGAVVEDSGATVEVDELPTLSADPFQMRQLMQNLVSNALKFRREGVAPVVRISATRRGRFADISVSDNGVGFEPQYAQRVFRIFERLHGREAYPGTGIGLALCRKIAERHGGAISATSTPGEGSTFTVSLPLEQSGIHSQPHVSPAVPVSAEEQEAPLTHA
jgi:signal transduction histidine kinase